MQGPTCVAIDHHVDDHIPRTGIEGNQRFFSLWNPGNVTNAPKVLCRYFFREAVEKHKIQKRDQRRPGAAGRNVRHPEIRDHRNSCSLGDHRCLTDLQASPYLFSTADLAFGDVMNGLPVGTNNRNLLEPQIRLLYQAGSGLGKQKPHPYVEQRQPVKGAGWLIEQSKNFCSEFGGNRI
ncbi:hypothetical protein ES705_45713 [subsurface metagenome]